MTGPKKKAVSSTEIRESGGEAFDVNLFCLFVFCLSINVILSIYIDVHLVNIVIENIFYLSIDERFVNI